MIYKFTEEISGKTIPSRFGGPVQHLGQEPLPKIISKDNLGGGSMCASAAAVGACALLSFRR